MVPMNEGVAKVDLGDGGAKDFIFFRGLLLGEDGDLTRRYRERRRTINSVFSSSLGPLSL